MLKDTEVVAKEKASLEEKSQSLKASLEEKNQSLLGEIDAMVDRAVQILELTSKEGEFIESIGSSIRIMLSTLKISLPLSPTIFHNDIPGIKSAVINRNGEIVIMQNNGNIMTKSFGELETHQVVDVMKEIVPSLSKSAETMKSQVAERISILRKMSKQLQRAQVEIEGSESADEESQ